MGRGQSDNHNCAAHISFPRYQVQQGEKEKGSRAGDGEHGVNVKSRNGKECGRNNSEYHSGDDHGTTSKADNRHTSATNPNWTRNEYEQLPADKEGFNR